MTPQQKRPLVLLHKCTECATFALAPIAPTEKKNMEIDSIRLKFAQVLGLNSGNRSTATIQKSDIGGDEDSAYGSSNSGQSSPDESPVSRSDSPSPTSNQAASISPNRPQNPFRCRSMSESGNTPLKGILKRRPVMRFLSQCEEEIDSRSEKRSESPSLDNSVIDIHWSNEDTSNISESGEDDDGIRERSQSSSSSMKKSVRFNDRVQENVFRPNSSILGQRKKNQKKQQRKRKRTNSGDSQTGGSENEENEVEKDSEDVGEENAAFEEDSEETENLKEDSEKSIESSEKVEKVPETEKSSKSSEKIEKSAMVKKEKKNHRKPATILENDKRYDGFIVGTEKKCHRRHSSGDSALGDDEDETDILFSKPVPKTGKKNRRRTVSCGDQKDSGLDD